MLKILRFIRWLLGSIFILIGISQVFTSSALSGIIGLVLGLFVSPLSPKLFGKLSFLDSRKKKISVAVALFIALVMASPQTENATLEAEDSTDINNIVSQTPAPVENTTAPQEAQSEEVTPDPISTPPLEQPQTPTPTSTPKPITTTTPKPTTIPTSTPTPAPAIRTFTNTAPSASWTCDCDKTCKEMSYEEAQYQLNSCGCSRRDGDNDGEACER